MRKAGNQLPGAAGAALAAIRLADRDRGIEIITDSTVDKKSIT